MDLLARIERLERIERDVSAGHIPTLETALAAAHKRNERLVHLCKHLAARLYVMEVGMGRRKNLRFDNDGLQLLNATDGAYQNMLRLVGEYLDAE